MSKIFIVRSAGGEVELCELGGLKVVYVFEQRALAQAFCTQMNNSGKLYKVEAIGADEFKTYIIPCLLKSSIDALIFNYIPGTASGPDAFSVDLRNRTNPRTYDFSKGCWMTARDARRSRLHRLDHR